MSVIHQMSAYDGASKGKEMTPVSSTIVCGLDLSDAAPAVAETADWLARGLEAKLVLLHATEEPHAGDQDLFAAIRERLGVPADQARKVEGAPADRLLEAVDEDGADLLVVGSRGRGSIRSALFGSVSRRLMTEATCPVVVVPLGVAAPRPGDSGDSSIVCGVDGSEQSIAGVQLGGELARRMGYRLVIVHALPNLEGYVSYPGARASTPSPSSQPDAARRVGQEIVDAAAEAVDGDAARVLEPGLPWDVLQAVAERENGQLLVVAARGMSSARAALLGSVASSLASSGRYPILLVPDAAEPRRLP
jgi:nucleotide-binding universal stress UspA family protein